MPSELITQLDEIQARVAALVKERDALRKALEELKRLEYFDSDGICRYCEGDRPDHLFDCPIYIATAALAGSRS